MQVTNLLTSPLGKPSKTNAPTPLAENHFAKKPLSEMGGTPPPLMESPPTSRDFFPKGAKNNVFELNKVKNGLKRP